MATQSSTGWTASIQGVLDSRAMSEDPERPAVFGRRSFVALVGLGLAACSRNGSDSGTLISDSSSPTSTTAQVTGNLSVYSALNESTNAKFFAAFGAVYPGVTVNLLSGSAGAIQTQLRAEAAQPVADVFIGGSSEFHDPLGAEGILEPYRSSAAESIDARFKDPTGHWTGWYTGVFGIMTNRSRLTQELDNRALPTWDSLLDPAWQQKIVLPDPLKTGGGSLFVMTQVFRFGRDEAKALEYLVALHANIAAYTASSSAALKMVVDGAAVACPNWAHDILTERAKPSAVDLTVPAQTGFEIGAVSIVRGTKNAAAARALVDWSLSREAGELNVQVSNRSSVRPDVAPAPGAPELSSVDLVDYDRAWATANRERILASWRTAVGR